MRMLINERRLTFLASMYCTAQPAQHQNPLSRLDYITIRSGGGSVISLVNLPGQLDRSEPQQPYWPCSDVKAALFNARFACAVKAINY
eukprot:scaffold70186_cov37-Prasinocladus_malaysianus.AAC.1